MQEDRRLHRGHLLPSDSRCGRRNLWWLAALYYERVASKDFAVLFGTRPEGIKLAPVILELRRRGHRPLVVTTGQHRELVTQVLPFFDITPDVDLHLMQAGQSLDHILSVGIARVGRILDERRPGAVIVQGDTTSTAGAALTAFHHGIPVAHIEAGLRSHDLAVPFPEEMNRRVTSLIARWHFAPTQSAAENLRAEGVTERVFVTGNTVVDALHHILSQEAELPNAIIDAISGHPYILATAHRRESWEGGIGHIAQALRDILHALPDHRLIFAVHPNPAARGPVEAAFRDEAHALVVDALPYPTFIKLLRGAALAISDSGGVQEEGPTLGVPVLVTRGVTERPEGVTAGGVEMVGTNRRTIVDHALPILSDSDRRGRMSAAGRELYGDGHAATRIVEELLSGGQPTIP